MSDIKSDIKKEEALFDSLNLLVVNPEDGLKGKSKKAFTAMQKRSKKNPDNVFLKEYVRKFDKATSGMSHKT